MQMLSMLGLSSDDITKLETALKAMAETPGKIDALIERINNLERSIKDGTTGTTGTTGTAGTAETAGTAGTGTTGTTD